MININYHWVIIKHEDGFREQILVADEKGEDCNAYNLRQETLWDFPNANVSVVPA